MSPRRLRHAGETPDRRERPPVRSEPAPMRDIDADSHPIEDIVRTRPRGTPTTGFAHSPVMGAARESVPPPR